MKIIAMTLAALSFAGSAEAFVAPTHIFEFSGSTSNQSGTLGMTAGTGATYRDAGTPQGGMRFLANQGPVVSKAFARPGVYSVEMFFSFDQVGSYRRIIDTKNKATDNGLYLFNGDLYFHGPSQPVNTNYAAGQMLHIVLTRDANQVVRGYGQGTELFSFNDTSGHNHAVFSGPDRVARFFNDDGSEASAGFVDFIRTYDRVLTGTEVATLYGGGTPLRTFAAVPEPKSWALMIGGFGLAGGAVRRGRAKAALPATA